MAVFTNNDQLDPLIEAIERGSQPGAGRDHQKGRDAIASMAHKVARSKRTSTTQVKTWSLS
jgi:hypothetical protein